MTDKQDELTGLLSSFHDFDIVEAQLTENVLTLGLVIPWGSMWIVDDYSYKIKVELLGCYQFLCSYWILKSKTLIPVGDNRSMRDTEEKATTIPTDILPLELSIQSSTFISPNKYEFHCIAGPEIDFATVTITADDYRIYDQNGNNITIDTFRQWHKDWWDGIQKMWDDQERKHQQGA
jgi:hypothetical protein